MSTKSKKAAATGVRYTDAEKQKVVDFVSEYNTANGRGGQSAAAKKFNVTPLTISGWLRTLGGKAAKPGKKIKTAKAPKAVKAPAKSGTKTATKKAGAGKRGVRYSPEEKQAVVDFVSDYNAANGRGGQNQAAKKFKLSVLTVSSWLKAKGVKAPKAAKAVKTVKTVKAVKVAEPSGLTAKVAALVAINKQVSAAEKELEKLYSKQDAVMASFK